MESQENTRGVKMKYGIVMGGIIDLETQKIARAKEVFDYMKELHENSEKLRKCVEYYLPILEEELSCGELARQTLEELK